MVTKKTTQAILRTLAYASLFQYPLTSAQMWRYIIGFSPSYRDFQTALSLNTRQKMITQNQGYYTLGDNKQVVVQRIQRQRIAQKKLRLTRSICQVLSFIPTIWGIGVSGALAMENAPLEDDIDLFIITAPHTLWVTRFMTIVLADFLGVRRQPTMTQFKNKICINMFLDSAKLTLPKHEQDLYSAHEVAQVKVIVDKHQIFEKFTAANNWVCRYLPHTIVSEKKTKKVTSPLLLSLAESVFKTFQLRYMHNRRTKEIVASYELRFHPIDMRRILTQYTQILHALHFKKRDMYVK